jgi:hypothetical protein
MENDGPGKNKPEVEPVPGKPYMVPIPPEIAPQPNNPVPPPVSPEISPAPAPEIKPEKERTNKAVSRVDRLKKFYATSLTYFSENF